MKKQIYLDYNATTPADPRIVKKVLPFFTEKFANPSSAHFAGIQVKKALERARNQVAKSLNCRPEEVVFTSGGTEAENLAIKGIAFANKPWGNHIIISACEHLATSTSAEYLEKHGFKITKISTDSKCRINLEELKSAIKENTTLVAAILVNNEVGSIQPIKKISNIIKQINTQRKIKGIHSIHLHTDAQAACFYMDCDVKRLGVNSLSINGSKMYSLKGAAALYIKKGTRIATQIGGGGQERFLRGGTENIPAIIALGEAAQLAKKERETNARKIKKLKSHLINKILKEIPSARLNTPENSIVNTVHFTFLDNTKNLVQELSKRGIAVSKGSACSAGSEAISATLTAMNFSYEEANSSLRFSLGKDLTKAQINYAVKALESIINSKK
jgi:cysteine desulfurase